MTKFGIIVFLCALNLPYTPLAVQKPRPRLSKSPGSVAISNRIIQGDVFVVTKGGQNVKLGLVEVRAIDKQAILKFLEDKKKNAEQEIENMTPQLEVAEREERGKKAAYEEATKERDRLSKAFLATKDIKEMEALNEQDKLAGREVLNKLQLSSKAQITTLAIKRKLSYWRSGEYYLSDLPSGIASAKTDADGKFELETDGKLEFCLAAEARREIGDKTEYYYWLVWPPLNTKRLFLSNDNLTTVVSADSLILTER